MALKPAPMWLNPTNRAATLHPKVTRIRVTPAISPEETLNRVLGAGPKRSVGCGEPGIRRTPELPKGSEGRSNVDLCLLTPIPFPNYVYFNHGETSF